MSVHPSSEWDFSSREAEIRTEIPLRLAPLQVRLIMLFGSSATGMRLLPDSGRKTMLSSLESTNSAVDTSLLGQVRQRLVTLPGLIRLVAFGSRARGDARADSDLDLMVVLANKGSLGDRAWEVRRRLLDILVPVDLIIYTPEEFEKVRRLKSSIAGIAEREGLILVG